MGSKNSSEALLGVGPLLRMMLLNILMFNVQKPLNH